jgi:hypothetical protein
MTARLTYVWQCAREHKYLGRVMLQYYGVVDGQALTATGAGGDASGPAAARCVLRAGAVCVRLCDGARGSDEWDIGTSVSMTKKKNALPDIASHCVRYVQHRVTCACSHTCMCTAWSRCSRLRNYRLSRRRVRVCALCVRDDSHQPPTGSRRAPCTASTSRRPTRSCSG